MSDARNPFYSYFATHFRGDRRRADLEVERNSLDPLLERETLLERENHQIFKKSLNLQGSKGENPDFASFKFSTIFSAEFLFFNFSIFSFINCKDV
jgi:hypothetical protein